MEETRLVGEGIDGGDNIAYARRQFSCLGGDFDGLNVLRFPVVGNALEEENFAARMFEFWWDLRQCLVSQLNRLCQTPAIQRQVNANGIGLGGNSQVLNCLGRQCALSIAQPCLGNVQLMLAHTEARTRYAKQGPRPQHVQGQAAQPLQQCDKLPARHQRREILFDELRGIVAVGCQCIVNRFQRQPVC